MVTYNDCFEVTQCNATKIDQIALEGNVDRTRIDCPPELSETIIVGSLPLPPIVDGDVVDATCPYSFPGSGNSCEATNLQCHYFLTSPSDNEVDIEWVCNCGAEPMEFFCKLKNE